MERVLIGIKFNDTSQYCDIRMNNLTKKSFLRDGGHIFCVYLDMRRIQSETYILFTVSAHICIDETSEIEIYDHRGIGVQMKHLKHIIEKFEKSENFFLQIKLVDDDMDNHAFVLMKVNILCI